MKRGMYAALAVALAGFLGQALADDDMMMKGGSGSMSGSGSMGGARGMGGMEHGGMQMGQGAGAMAEGEVRKVDRAAGKITLRHGPIASLDMPAMTMVYGVNDRSALDHLSVGDKVKFAAEKTGAGYTVTQIERAQ